MRAGAARSIVCPACNRGAGERCTDGGREMVIVHRVRTALAKQRAGDELSRYETVALRNYALLDHATEPTS